MDYAKVNSGAIATAPKQKAKAAAQKRRASLSAKFSSPDLFAAGQPATEVINVEPKTEQDATDHTTAEGISDEGQGQ